MGESVVTTRNGEAFPYDSLAGYLVQGLGELELPAGADRLGPKRRGLCIDDGIVIRDPRQQITPVSGVGIGEDPAKIAEIMAGVKKIKPHRGCGKAALVLSERLRAAGREEPPTAKQIDWFAQRGAAFLASLLRIECGRTLEFDDGRKTQLVRPPDHHPATGAVIGLSGRFLHNLLPDERETPPQFRIAGHYLHKPHLRETAVGEAMLALAIASGPHGVGVVPGGFQFTALVDEDDQQRGAKLAGLAEVWDRLQGQIAAAAAAEEALNQASLDIVCFAIRATGNSPRVEFGRVANI